MKDTGKRWKFLSDFKDIMIAFLFDLGGLFAGLVIASQLGVFDLSPWAIALYPAILSAKGVIGGLLSGRLSTALHLGTAYPRFFNNTKSFYKLVQALVVITFSTSVAMSAVSLIFGYLFLGISVADFPGILLVVVSTMAIGLFLSLITIKVAFISFKRGLDPDVVVYPVMSTVADIFITLCYVVVLNLFFSFDFGNWVIAFIVLAFSALVIYILPKNKSEPEFIKTLKEALATMIIVAFIVNITGMVLKSINNFVTDRRGILITIYPVLMNMIGDVGSVVGSTATTKLALGLLTPSFSAIRNHARTVLSAWIASITMFIVLAITALLIHGNLTLGSLSKLILVLLIANMIAVAAVVLLSYGVSILTFKRGLDPDNFVIPIESSFADSMMSVALLAALLLIG